MVPRQTLEQFTPAVIGGLLLAGVMTLRLQGETHASPAPSPAAEPAASNRDSATASVSDPRSLVPDSEGGEAKDPAFAIATGRVQSPDGVAVAGARITIKGRDHLGRPVLRIGEQSRLQEGSGQLRLVPIGELGVTKGLVPPITAAISGNAPTPFAPWTTRANGEFAAGGLPAGRYRAYVSHHAFAPVVSEEFVLLKGASFTLPQPLALRRSGHLQVRVLDLEGNPAAHAIVSLESADLPLPWTSATNAEGIASFNNLVGSVFVDADVGEESLREQTEVPEGRSVELVLRLTGIHSDSRLSGTVVDKLGHVVEGARITTSGPGPEHKQSRQTNERGEFSIQGLSSATIEVKASHPSGGAVTKTLDYDAKFGLLNLVMHLPDTAFPIDPEQAEPEVPDRQPDARSFFPGSDARTHTTSEESTPGAEEHEGVAIEVERKGNGVGIAWVAPGSYAARVGLRRGQVIVAVNGQSVLVPSQARSALRGKPGSTAKVRIRTSTGPKTIPVRRESYKR